MDKTIIPTRRTQNIKGTEYVYDDYPYWDKDKKQNRHNRDYVGRLGPNGEFIPNKAYKKRMEQDENKGENALPETKIANRVYFGSTFLLNRIGEDIGIESDIKRAFPNSYKELLSLAFYLVLQSDSPMYRFPRWGHDHWYPSDSMLNSQSISTIMASISEGGKMEFFRLQSNRRQEKEYLAYDTTSVSSWSEFIRAARYGKNKDGDSLPQVNMALVFGETSGLPVYYRVLPGNISDVVTVKKLLKDISFLEIKKLKLVLDRGFFSAQNINALYKDHYKFLISAKANGVMAAAAINSAKPAIKDFKNYDLVHDVYCWSVSEKWLYEKASKSGNVIGDMERRIYIHVYYNGQRAEDEKVRFNKSLAKTESALRSGTELTETQQSLASKYLDIHETPKRGIKIAYQEDAIRKHLDNIGYFVLMSNEIKDSKEAIEIYRKKDMVEKAFDNLKDRLEMKRTQVHSDETLTGRFFLQFLALIFVSQIHKCMMAHDLYKNYTMQSLFDALDVIERYEFGGQRAHYSEITEKQQKLFQCFNIEAPSTL